MRAKKFKPTLKTIANDMAKEELVLREELENKAALGDYVEAARLQAQLEYVVWINETLLTGANRLKIS